MTKISRAVLFHGPQRDLEIVDAPLPKLKPGELLVRVTASTLCGSDLHTFRGERSAPCPTILGHEILGTVAEIPPGETAKDHLGNPLNLGDRITWGIAASCGACFYCRKDLPQKCERLFKYGHEPFDESHPLSGGLAQFCHLAAGTPILRVPQSLPDAVACPANCATATIAAAFRTAGDCSGGTILIHGAGMLGLTAAAMGRTLGCGEIILADINPERLKKALTFGATRTVSVGEGPEELDQLVQEVTGGHGVDVAIDVSGAGPAMRQGLSALRIGGRAIWVGAVFPAPPLEILAEDIVRRLLTIRGVHNYIPADLVTALDFLERNQRHFPFESLIAEKFLLEDAATAFAAAQKNGVFRVMIRP